MKEDDKTKEVFETWAEKQDRCDGYVDGGPMDRSIMLGDEVTRRAGGRKMTPEEFIAAKDAIPPEEQHKIYLAGLMARGMTEAQALEVLKREATFGLDDDDLWAMWYERKLIEAGEITEDGEEPDT